MVLQMDRLPLLPGVLELAGEAGYTLTYWHVMDTGRDSIDLLTRLLDRFGDRLDYVLVLNQLHGDDFAQLEKSGQMARARALGARFVAIKKLHDTAVQKIDAGNSSFWAATQSGEGAKLGLMDRQRLKMWLSGAYAEISKAQP